MCRNSAISGENNRFEPELALFTRDSDMDVRRLIWFVGIEVKTVGPNA